MRLPVQVLAAGEVAPARVVAGAVAGSVLDSKLRGMSAIHRI